MTISSLAHIRIVLVEPAGALNVGSVARVMKNMGLADLVLVKPQCDRLGAEARLMAVRASDVLESAREVETLAEALQGCVKAIATSGRDRATFTTPIEMPRLALPWLLDAPAALIFGREDSGLTNAEMNHAQRLIQIPSTAAYLSLNLAQAVGICCYELASAIASSSLQESDPIDPPLDPPLDLPNPPSLQLAPLDDLEGYYQQLNSLLLEIGYLYPHTASSRMEKFRKLLNRAYPTTSEVAMLRGVLRQMAWALKSRS
ncbi:MAG: RNA methyltransferase [Timaviella obliquedivisa GSE-PSE-MK23-08B]|nr:RNA methyltransferase [Timaviella obliquedivisa GSE-PSE-MK23-08B]